MKKILEMYDISNDYQNYQGNPYVIVINATFEINKTDINKILNSNYTVLTNKEWIEYTKAIIKYNNNDAKHRMRKECPIEYATSNKLKRINVDEIYFDNNSNVAKAINMLSPRPKSRFIKYYIDGKTYKEIAIEEGKHISSIYESVEGAKKKFLKYLNIFENTPEK